MCSASSRPTIASASKLVMQQGAGIRPFFAGVGPRALSNGLNSAFFFCFFEAIRGVRPGLPLHFACAVQELASACKN